MLRAKTSSASHRRSICSPTSGIDSFFRSLNFFIYANFANFIKLNEYFQIKPQNYKIPSKQPN